MKPLQRTEEQRKAILLLFLPLLLALSLAPSVAVAEMPAADEQASGGGQSPVALEAQADNGDADSRADAEVPQGLAAGNLAAEADGETGGDISVTVELASESNARKDIYVGMTYNDNFLAQSSSIYNDNLAYASTCLATGTFTYRSRGTQAPRFRK
jgi:hypothetical protein